MNELTTAITTAVWLGILTSISPCPLATNIAAVSFIGREIERPRRVVLSGLLYTAGRMTAYAILGILLVKSMLAAFHAAGFLQKTMNQVLGVLLLLTGLVLLRIIPMPDFSSGSLERWGHRLAGMGLTGAFLLGGLFALSFCPVSAALFFGSLVPLAMKLESGVLIPWCYGLGTALPVLVFAIAVGLGTHAVARAFNRMTIVEVWFRRITGVLFTLLGVYYLYQYVWQPLIR